MNKSKAFGERLRNLIKSRGLTQRKVAHDIGVSPAALSLYCSGKRGPIYDVELKISRYFGVTLSFLETGCEK